VAAVGSGVRQKRRRPIAGQALKRLFITAQGDPAQIAEDSPVSAERLLTAGIFRKKALSNKGWKVEN